MNIPRSFCKIRENTTVIDAFLESFSFEVSQITKPIVKLAENVQSSNSKRKIESKHNELYSLLQKFPPSDDTFSTLITSFSSIAKSNHKQAFDAILHFCPVVLGVHMPYKSTEQTLLSFFAPTSSNTSDSAIIIGFFCDAVFSIFVSALLDQLTYPDELIMQPILDRLFVRTNLPPINSFAFRVLNLAILSYKKIVTRICSISFNTFASTFNKLFPTSRTNPAQIMIFMNASVGMKILPHDFQCISAKCFTLTSLINEYASDDQVINYIFLFLCELIAQIQGEEKFVSHIEKKAHSFIRSPNAWRSSLRLLGVIHYRKFPGESKTFQKLLKKKVFDRFVKPKKLDAALDYLIALIRPSHIVDFNWSIQLEKFIRDVMYKPFSECNIDGHIEIATTLITNMAAIDLDCFSTTWYPQYLDKHDHFTSVALLTASKILNPLTEFQARALKVPTNAAVGIKPSIKCIIDESMKFIADYFNNWEIEPSKCSFDFKPASEIICDVSAIGVPTKIAALNSYGISSPILFLLLNFKDHHFIRKMCRMKNEELISAKTTCKDSLKQWMSICTASHESFGNIFDEMSLEMVEEYEFKHSIEADMLPLFPILLYYTKEPAKLILPIIHLIASPDIVVSSSASIIFELICIAFPEYSIFCIEQIGECFNHLQDYTASQIHQFILTFFHCLTSQISILTQTEFPILLLTDFIAFVSLCSPYPETRQVGIDIIDTSSVLTRFVKGAPRPSLYDYLIKNSKMLEQHIIISVISAYSSINNGFSLIHKLPTIPLKVIACSPYINLWRFALSKIDERLLDSPMADFLLYSQDHFYSNLKDLESYEHVSKLMKNTNINNLAYLTNLILFVFTTASPIGPSMTKEQLDQWRENQSTNNSFIKLLVINILKAELSNEQICSISFVLSSIHISSILSILDTLHGLATDESLPSSKQELISEIMSIVLHKFAMHNDFIDYIGRGSQTGQIQKIFSFYDLFLQMFINVPDQPLDPHMTILINYLIFKSHYFKFLHQSRIKPANGPFPRCAISLIDNKKEISEVCSKEKLFLLLFKWSLSDSKNNKDRKYQVFRHVSRMAISYLASLTPIYTKKTISALNDDYFYSCSSIAEDRPTFLKHLLTHHFDLLFDKYVDKALTMPPREGSRFLKAISSQFIPPTEKNSLIYTQDTFMKNLTNIQDIQLSEEEINYVQSIYQRSGKILFLSLLFLLHRDLHVRQDALRMIAQIAPVVCLLLTKGNNEVSKNLLIEIRKQITIITTNISALRLQSVIDFSMYLSSIFTVFAEYFINIAFSVLTKISPIREDCNRRHILKLLHPWMQHIEFDMKQRTIVKHPDPHFILYSPYNFVFEVSSSFAHLFQSSHQVEPEELEIWLNLTKNSRSPKQNMKFITLVLIDFAISQPIHQEYVLTIFGYLYRLDPVHSVQVISPFLNFSNWYFRHIQIGKFEEIDDMTNFLKSNRELVKQANLSENYQASVDFALDALIHHTDEDVQSLLTEYDDIVSFCLTHISNQKAFKVLNHFIQALKEAHDSGIPDCLLNACEYLNKIDSLKYEEIEFVIDPTDSPLRTLQERKVSLTYLYKLLLDVQQEECDTECGMAGIFLLWGVSCGDLTTAATALHLFVFDSKRIEDPRIVAHIIESMCLILRCMATSKYGEDVGKECANYIDACICAIKSMKTSIISERASMIFWLVISIIEFNPVLCKIIINDVLSLLIILIKKHKISPLTCKSPFTDMREVVMTLIQSCSDMVLILTFLNSLISMPKEILSKDGDFTIYLISFLPILMLAVKESQLVPKYPIIVANLSKIFTSNTICSEIIRNLENHEYHDSLQLAQDVCGVSSSITDQAALIISGFLNMAHQLPNLIFYEIAYSLLLVNNSDQTIYNLAPIIKAAVEDQITFFSNKNEFMTLIISSISLQQLLTREKPADNIIVKPEWEVAFNYIQRSVQPILHKFYQSKEERFQIKFDGISKFLPIFPCKPDFIKCACLEEYLDLFRSIDVKPFTNWTYNIYCARDLSDLKANDDNNIHLDLSIPFHSIMEELFNDFASDADEEEDAGSNQSYSSDSSTYQTDSRLQSQSHLPIISIEGLIPIDPLDFIPSMYETNQFVPYINLPDFIGWPV